MLRFKVLNNDSELLEFSNLYESAFKNKETICYKLPFKKLKARDKVVGVYKKDIMVAGYSLSNTPNTLADNITSENKIRMKELCPLDSCYDLANIWKKGISTIQFSAIVWPRIIFDTAFFNLQRPHIVGYVLTGHGRKESYNKANPFYIQSSEEKNGLNILAVTRINLIKGLIIGLCKEITKVTFSLIPKPRVTTLSEIKK